MSQHKILIPARISRNLDCKQYTVSKLAYSEIKSLFDEPILEISSADPAIKESPVIYKALLLKRSIYLLFKFICESRIMKELLSKNVHLAVQQNIFTLRNISHLRTGKLKHTMQHYLGSIIS